MNINANKNKRSWKRKSETVEKSLHSKLAKEEADKRYEEGRKVMKNRLAYLHLKFENQDTFIGAQELCEQSWYSITQTKY